MSLVSIIVAMARHRVIGRENRLPWHLPEDLRRFKKLTMGAPVIMGRKTFESIHATLGGPLPGRRNVVITHQRDMSLNGCTITHSLEEALATSSDAAEVFVIGGAEIYRLALPRADRLYLTLIDADCEGDAYFPEIDFSAWREREREPGMNGGLCYAFVTYERARA